ncbi:hypothetical protein [Streptomyces acidiscabies]|uniref:hypothetical protein n=1 Tax=Streptomyces acidiscabies TaxID=42234 RepID=UPI0038F81FE1
MTIDQNKKMPWKIIHRTRTEVRSGVFEGVFLGVDGDRWIAGRMYTGKAMSDGFGENGEWWYSHSFASPNRSGVRNMRDAVASYIEMGRAALVGDVVFERSTWDTVDRYLVGQVPLDGVADMAAGWEQTGADRSVNALGGSTYLLPAALAKRQLLGYLRRTASEAGPPPTRQGLSLDEAYERVIDADGPVRFEVGRNTYWLTHDGHYSDRHRFRRHPYTERRGNDS